MGYDNVLFNGKSMRNAIITKLSEDKHLTSALFANSNITILVDIISYMYQCLMSNLRQAASESMWSDTIFFENATRLAKLIGYYAKSQIPFTMLAKKINNNAPLPDFGRVNFSYGPYEYDFAVVEDNVNGNQSLIKLALGNWVKKTFTSDGTKFQEFIVENKIQDDHPSFITNKYVKVKVHYGTVVEDWFYSPDPLFLIQNENYTSFDAEEAADSRSLTTSNDKTKKFNFYINENGDYVLKFGDGLSTAIPPNKSTIEIYYISSTETDSTITQAVKTALSNAAEAKINNVNFDGETGDRIEYPSCIPITPLSGYKKGDDANSIRQNSRSAFSRQNRLVTKEDYRTFLLENYPEWADITVQNNWEYISTFYGWLYAIAKSVGKNTSEFLNTNKLQAFQSPDLADANNVYIWVLDKNTIEADEVEINDDKIGIMNFGEGIDKSKSGNSLGAIKDITEHPVFLHAICKRFLPFADPPNVDIDTIIDYDSPDPFHSNYKSFFRIHVDSNYANNLNMIKSKTISLMKFYLFDNIKLGKTPNIPALIKDLMNIDGIINVTTVFNSNGGNIETEIEVPGMKFCTWTDTNNQLISASDDVHVAFNLPNIPCFQYFKAAQSYQTFIDESLEFKIDYSIKS